MALCTYEARRRFASMGKCPSGMIDVRGTATVEEGVSI